MVKGISNTGTVWVAIDVAKRSHQVVVETPQGRTRRFRVQQNRKDYEAFSGYLQKLGGEVVIGLEPTGDYHRTLAHYLLRHGFQVHLLSSVAVSRVREAVFNSWDKNDPKDADVLLQMLQQGFHDIQELSKTYRQVTLARSRLLHSLCNHYLPLYFPGPKSISTPRELGGLPRPSFAFRPRVRLCDMTWKLSSNRPGRWWAARSSNGSGCVTYIGPPKKVWRYR